MRLIARLASQIICISRYTLETQPKYLQDKSQIIFNPFNIDQPLSEAEQPNNNLKAELGEIAETRLIGFVGNLRPQKRPDVFVELAGHLAKALRGKLSFVIVGADQIAMQAELERKIKNFDPVPNVHFLGSRTPIRSIMSAFDVLVAPAVDEAFGRTLVEAMLLNVPVVATASAGHKEIITDQVTGWLVEPDDPKSLALAVEEVLRCPEKAKEISSAAFNHARNNFSAKAHTLKITEIYRRQLSNKPNMERQ